MHAVIRIRVQRKKELNQVQSRAFKLTPGQSHMDSAGMEWIYSGDGTQLSQT